MPAIRPTCDPVQDPELEQCYTKFRLLGSNSRCNDLLSRQNRVSTVWQVSCAHENGGRVEALTCCGAPRPNAATDFCFGQTDFGFFLCFEVLTEFGWFQSFCFCRFLANTNFGQSTQRVGWGQEGNTFCAFFPQTRRTHFQTETHPEHTLNTLQTQIPPIANFPEMFWVKHQIRSRSCLFFSFFFSFSFFCFFPRQVSEPGERNGWRGSLARNCLFSISVRFVNQNRDRLCHPFWIKPF